MGHPTRIVAGCARRASPSPARCVGYIGGLKLKCELVLKRAHEAGGFPFTTLRPPSVIGPACDNRHERLQRLIKSGVGEI